jgi:cytochrome c peroxidase
MMKRIKIKQASLLLSVVVIVIFFHSFTVQPLSVTQKIKEYYGLQLTALKQSLLDFRKDVVADNATRWTSDLLHCRKVYKKAEIIIAYQYPLIAKRLNGPAVMEAEITNPNESVIPTGFQVIEELLFDGDVRQGKGKLLKQIDYIIAYVGILQNQVDQLSMGRSELYDAIKLNLCTMASLGLSGFDSPLLLSALDEGKTTLEESAGLLTVAGENSKEIQQNINQCLQLLNGQQTTFDNFDRSHFLVKGWRPLVQALYEQQQARKIPFVPQRKAIRNDVAGFLEANAFDPYFFAPDSIQRAGIELIALGKALFAEPALSASGRSCAGCHKPELAFTDGLKLNRSLQSDEQLQRNTPTIINAALQPVLFADARVNYLEEQAHDVILNKKEMDGRSDEAIKALSSSARYRQLFSKAFPEQRGKIDQANIIAALAAFERSLIRLNAPFDRFMRGDSLAMTAQQQQGFNLFMGKAKCGTCHFMPLFNGAVPPFYDRQDAEIIGVPSALNAMNRELDPDLGVYQLFRFPIKKGAFKTPTLRNVAQTAPYMHNGLYPTLEEVIDFYDKGGGAGLGIVMEQQTLSQDKLLLTPQEKTALVAFLKALSDQ